MFLANIDNLCFVLFQFKADSVRLISLTRYYCISMVLCNNPDKLLFIQIFGTPAYHPKSQPFFDRVVTFSVLDNRIWFRNFQILTEDGALAEIGMYMPEPLTRQLTGNALLRERFPPKLFLCCKNCILWSDDEIWYSIHLSCCSQNLQKSTICLIFYWKFRVKNK